MGDGHSDYQRGDMPIDGHNKTFDGFVSKSAYMTALIVVVLLMPTLVLTAGVSWPLALAITFVIGLILGPAFKLDASWYPVLIGLSILAVGICLIVDLFN